MATMKFFWNLCENSSVDYLELRSGYLILCHGSPTRLPNKNSKIIQWRWLFLIFFWWKQLTIVSTHQHFRCYHNYFLIFVYNILHVAKEKIYLATLTMDINNWGMQIYKNNLVWGIFSMVALFVRMTVFNCKHNWIVAVRGKGFNTVLGGLNLLNSNQ